ncbi:MAG: hypothetical protein R3F29_01870 [Planctomycetota bacterium]
MSRLAIRLAVASLLATPSLLAQNDECATAVYVTQGANGPFDTAVATTSAEPWACGAGERDLWFTYVAPASGSLTADVCGASFDTLLEIFDASGGCGSLTSVGCNDDSCGLASSVTIAVTAGTEYRIRVGGYDEFEFGDFTLTINGPVGSGTVATTAANGAGCGGAYASFFELLQAADMDLSNTAFTMFPTNPGYVIIPTGGYVAPGAGATVLALADDGELAQSLATAFPYDGGSASALTVCSNGFVSVASNGTDYDPNLAQMLGNAETGWYVWHDMNQTETGSGSIKFEEVGGVAYFTWDGVYEYGGTSAADASTFQLQFDGNTGAVTFAFGTMSTANASETPYLVGYSPGGAGMVPAATDLSALGGGDMIGASDTPSLTLAAVSRPVLGTAWTLQTSQIPANGVLGVEVLGVSNPAIADLGFLGMPGCGLYSGLDSLNPWIVSGTTHSWSLAIPVSTAFLNVPFFASSAVFQVPATNAFGAITSNGVAGICGDL